MRELYRAKDKVCGLWKIGQYQTRIDTILEHSPNGNYPVQQWNEYIVTKKGKYIQVDGNTVCRYIGKADMLGKYIYEHDFLQIHGSNDIVEVKWDNDTCGFCYRFFDEGQEKCIYPDERSDFKVIGNFFDNPEMYKALHASRLETESDDEMIPEDEPVITMENYRDFGLYTKEDVLNIVAEALSKI